MSDGRRPNRLIGEKSPYLLQHAHNPVEWFPWGDEAFAKARREDKPVFLSVGYSTCHWCHVMERESFENDAVAAALNEGFVAIKVDREERPDVDRVYMNAAFAVSGQGGWPLSVFLTPDGKPFYAGTYFPPETAHGRPGFLDLLRGVREAWQGGRAQIEISAAQLAAGIRQAMQVAPDAGRARAEELMAESYEHLEHVFDERWGGFGRAPKFPQPSQLAFLLRAGAAAGRSAAVGGEGAAAGRERALEMALTTLRRMAMGGLHDHLGGGFHRYSTDAEWRVPHFEKMLYDQAQLACVYLEAHQVTRDPFFAGVARGVFDYVGRDLTHPDGGFYSAEDADSRGPDGRSEEGAFYAWTVAEVEGGLGAEPAAPFLRHYGFTAAGNFESGKNVLHASDPPEATAAQFGLTPAQLEERLAAGRAALFRARAARPRPHLDDKVLTAWNGLMISALARGHQVLGEARYLESARRAAEFVWARLYDEASATLRRRWRDGEAAVPGGLADYAFLAQGLLDLYEAGFDARDLERALALTDRQVALFWDEAHGGFFDTVAGADERLFVRTKEAHDGAEPAGNSVAVLNLARLARMTGRRDLENKARRTLDLFAAHVARSPLALPQMWVAAGFLAGRPLQVVIAGCPGAADTRALLVELRAPFLPDKVVLLADGGEGQAWLAERHGFLRSVGPLDGRAAAYVCEDFVCKLPTDSPRRLAELLAGPPPEAARS